MLQIDERPPFTATLRRCQEEAIRAWSAEKPDSALIDMIPGSGKTLLIARLAHAILSASAARPVLVVEPTAYLRTQVARELSGLGVQLTDEFKASWRVLPTHLDGATLTYAQIAMEPEIFRRLAMNAFVALDEVHHVGEHATWGAAVQHAFSSAKYRLLLSGTAFRTDDGMIPFVTYRMGEAQPIYRYGYPEGLKDGIVRPAAFELVGAQVKWRSSDGTERQRLTSENVSEQETRERLRAVVNSREWVRAAFTLANQRLHEFRREGHSRAAGLIGAIDVDHAKTIARWLAEDYGVAAVVVTSDDPGSIAKIDAFRDSDDEWLVAVRQVSEGVNVPRIRCVLWATTTVSKLFFWQFVGRALRIDPAAHRDQEAYVVLPEDPELVHHAQTMERDVRLWGWGQPVGGPSEPTGPRDTDSQFGVLSTESYTVGRVKPLEEDATDVHEAFSHIAAIVASASSTLDALKIQREEVNRLVRNFARVSGESHSSIHAKLKRRCGGQPLARAAPEQIARRVVLLRRAIETGRLGQ